MNTQDYRTGTCSFGARALYATCAALSPFAALAQQASQAPDIDPLRWVNMWWAFWIGLFVLAVLVLWILLPFAVFGIKGRLETMIALQREQLDEMRRHASGVDATQALEPDHHEAFITARGGTLTYRVLSPFPMSQDDCAAAVADALQRGALQEPPPGGIATLVVPPS